MNEASRNPLTSEIGELEKIMATLTRLPQLMRAGYWITRVEQLLGRSGLSSRDRERLIAVLDQIHACLDRTAGAAALPLAA